MIVKYEGADYDAQPNPELALQGITSFLTDNDKPLIGILHTINGKPADEFPPDVRIACATAVLGFLSSRVQATLGDIFEQP